MAVEPVHNLPRFKDNAPFPRPDRPGEWVEQHGSLKKLGQSLRVDEDPFADPDEPIRAIPDPWAQARTFAEALIDHEHSMHRSFEAQWRGLLALFALRRLYKDNYTLDGRPVPLDGSHILERVLSRLSPRLAIGDDVGLWTKPAVVYAIPAGGRARPIAMLNPACLVSPGRLALHIDIPNVSWARNGLADPLSLSGRDRLSPAALVILRAWLENLRSALGGASRSVPGDAIRDRLQDYIDDIEAQLGATPLAARVGQGFDPKLEPIYHPLWSTADLDEVEDPAATSECRLALSSKTGHGAFKGLILVDESVARTTGKGTHEVLVWGHRTLGELLGSQPLLEETRRQAAERGYFVVTADDLFTPCAVRLTRKPRIPGHPPAFKDVLIPVRPLALLLEGNLRDLVEADNDVARCSVILKAKLSQEGAQATVMLQRHYRVDSDDANTRLLTDVNWAFVSSAVWPNFRTHPAEAWTNYFARHLYQKMDEWITPRHALSRAVLDAALATARDGLSAVTVLSQINKGASPVPEQAETAWYRSCESSVAGRHDVVQSSTFAFDAIFHVYHDEELGEVDAGCTWIDAKVIEPGTAAMECAVDFGTTNTVACFRDKEAISFQPRLVHPITFESSEDVKRQLHIYRWNLTDFMPADQRQLPTPTVAITRTGGDANAKISIFRNVIYFPPAGEYASGGAEEELKKYQNFFARAMFNLKWSDDPAHFTAASDFLEQMVLMISAEAVARKIDPRNLKWRFSLPDSMPKRTRRQFEPRLAVLTAKSGKLEGLYSEGMAAAKYMLAGNSGANLVPGSVNAILDIGGGTTDITMWADDELLWRGSFRLAGQSFFTRTIVQNSQILRSIGLGDWADLLDPPKAAAGEQFEGISNEDVPHLAELLFSGPALPRAFDEHWSTRLNLRTGDTLRIAALTFISGIASYLGQVARQLADDPSVRFSEDQLATPTFALCGRGAGLFGRIHGLAPPNANTDVTAALTVFSHAANAPGKPLPRLYIEPECKLEVVRGMVTDYANIDAHADTRREALGQALPAGLDIGFSSGAEVKSGESIREPIEGGRVASVDLSMLEDFLRRLAEETDIRIDLREGDTEGAQAMIRHEVRAHIGRSRDEAGRTEFDEPPFITALRALIGEIAKAEDDPTRRIGIEIGQ